jgi:hypothetical protein
MSRPDAPLKVTTFPLTADNGPDVIEFTAVVNDEPTMFRDKYAS